MVVCGYHAVEESLRSGLRGTLLISRHDSRAGGLKALAADLDVPVRSLSGKELSGICGHERHQGVALLSEVSPEPVKKDLQDSLASIEKTHPLVVLLDELNDPHNLGAILRSADQLGVDLVVTTSRRSVSETPAVLRSSAGASSYIRLIAVPNLVRAMEMCKSQGYWIYGADVGGERLTDQRFAGAVALVMGGEHRGLRRLVRETCDFLVRIPSDGQLDSFNVSVAAGILLYEIRRQQGFPDFP